MGFVDPARFRRFEQFLGRYLRHFAEAARRGFAEKGPGLLIYYAPDDQFAEANQLRLEYKTKAEVDELHAGSRDDLVQGILERYQPPDEAAIIAIYPDNTYDISRVVLGPAGGGGTQPGGKKRGRI